jgi:hypothetical protein
VPRDLALLIGKTASHGGLQHHITITIATPSAPQPDPAATQRMADAAITESAARRAERTALDDKPPSATRATT